MSQTSQLQNDLQKYFWAPFVQMATYRQSPPLIITRAKGSRVWDSDGREYIDGTAGLWLVNAGYGRQEIVEAAARQLGELAWFHSFVGFSNPKAIELAKRLVELLGPEGMGKIFFTGSGSESMDAALKIARQYWKLRGRSGRYKLVGRFSAYHGVTFGALSVSGLPRIREMFEPLLPGARHAAAPYRYRCDYCRTMPECSLQCAEDVRRIIEGEGPETVAAFVAEPVMGVGVLIPDPRYFRRVREICDRYGVLLIADEVITGFGRTGEWFGTRRFGVKPDIMTFAKGLTSGYLPLGAVAVRDEIYDAFLGGTMEGKEFNHGNTYAGHPAACAAALANLEIIEGERLPDRADRVGKHLLKQLKQLESFDCVGEVDGIGMLARVELVKDRGDRTSFPADRRVGSRVAAEALKEGVIVRPRGDTLTLSPPLILTEDEAERIATAIARAIERVQAAGF